MSWRKILDYRQWHGEDRDARIFAIHSSRSLASGELHSSVAVGQTRTRIDKGKRGE